MAELEQTNKERIDLLFKKYDDLADASTWQGNFLHSELGYKPKPDTPTIQGNVYKQIKSLIDELKIRCITHEDIIKGPKDKWGLESKVQLLWSFLIPVWAFIGGIVAMGFKELIKKVF